MRELTVENAFTREAKRRGCWAPKGKLASVAGFPDRPVLAPGGRIAFVELKRPGKFAEPLQVWIHKKLRKLGFRVQVIDRPEQVVPFFDDWLGAS